MPKTRMGARNRAGIDLGRTGLAVPEKVTLHKLVVSFTELPTFARLPSSR